MSKYDSILTPREREIYYLLVTNIKGLTYTELAEKLHITYSTFKTHVISIFRKTGIKSEVELIIKYYCDRG